MAGFDFTGITTLDKPRGVKVIQADKEGLRLQLSSSGRVFRVTGDGKGSFSLYIESPEMGYKSDFVMRTDSLERILQLVGYKVGSNFTLPDTPPK